MAGPARVLATCGSPSAFLRLDALLREGGHPGLDVRPDRTLVESEDGDVRVVDVRGEPDAAERIAAIRGADPRSPIVALIDPADAVALEEAFRAGATEVLAGPSVTPAALTRSIAIARARSVVEAAARTSERNLLAAVVHDLRSPLTGVIGMTGLLMETKLDERQADFVDTIRSCSDTLLSLINDFLDLSRLEAGRVDLERIDFDVRTTAEEILQMFAAQVRERQVDLALLTSPSVPEMLAGDPSRLRQILTNLVANAVKFTTAGEVTLSIDVAGARGADEVTLLFSVSDTGIGIPKDRIDRLFSPYGQADATVSRRFGGTGLGLFICKRLSELMGGRIGVESREGEGSTFWFTARFGRTAARAAETRGEAPAPRVLLIDPQAADVLALAGELARLGVHAVAHDGETPVVDALTRAADRGEPFDVAILSLHGSEESTLDLARAIRRRPDLGSVRLVQIVEFGRRGDAARARTAGVDAYLTQPVQLPELAECAFHLASIDAHDGPELVTRHTLTEARRVRLPRFLVVHEDPAARRRAVRAVNALGYRSDAVADAADALAALRVSSYVAVVAGPSVLREGTLASAPGLVREGTALIGLFPDAATAPAGTSEEARPIFVGREPADPDSLREPVERAIREAAAARGAARDLPKAA